MTTQDSILDSISASIAYLPYSAYLTKLASPHISSATSALRSLPVIPTLPRPSMGIISTLKNWGWIKTEIASTDVLSTSNTSSRVLFKDHVASSSYLPSPSTSEFDSVSESSQGDKLCK